MPFNTIKPIIKESKSVVSNIRREEVVLTRIGHTRITHSWLLIHDEQPNCTGCYVPFTVKHFMLDYLDFQQARRSFFQVNNLHDLFCRRQIRLGLHTNIYQNQNQNCHW